MKQGKLLYANNADILYAAGEYFPDKYIYFEDSKGKKHACFASLEIDRAKQNCELDHIHSLESIIEILKQEEQIISITNVIKHLLDMTDTYDLIIPSDFPANLYQGLTSLGVELHIKDCVFPERIVKNQDEIEKIKEAQRMNESAFRRAFKILEESTIGEDNILFWNDEVLTSEIIRAEMNMIIAKKGGVASLGGPIVACGEQGALVHEIGTGPLYANELIVIDSYPRHENLYYSDISRTVIKGKASKEQEKLYQTVKNAQKAAFENLKAGVMGSAVHKSVQEVMDAEGYKSGMDKEGNRIGFFHSTGHNLGLDCHDVGLAIGKGNNLLQAGQVLTVEPGLYYPGIGGVRIEDTVVVTEDGFENLTDLSKFLVIE